MTTRRQFLNLTGSAATGLALGSCGENEVEVIGDPPDPNGWIDAHVHVWTPDTKAYPLKKGASADQMKPPSFTPEELFAHCHPDGVTRIVLIQMSYYGYDNSYMLDMMRAYPGTFGGVSVIDIDGDDVSGVMKDHAKQGVKGFRIRAQGDTVGDWFTSEGMKKMWQTGAGEKLSMCCLSDADALPGIRKMCEIHPETPVMIDHFSRIGVSGTIGQSDLDNLLKLAEFDTVSVKVSAFYALGAKAAPYTDLGDMVRQLRDAYGPERLMWATDCPYQVQKGHTYADSIALIRDRLDFLSAEDKEWMLRKTAEKLFF